MKPENRLKLKQGIIFNDNKATCEMEPSSYNIANSDIHKNHLNQRSGRKPFSIGTDDLKKFLFANVRNHNLPKITM